MKKTLLEKLQEEIDLGMNPEVEVVEPAIDPLATNIQKINPEHLKMGFERGRKLIDDICSQCNAIPTFVDFVECKVMLYFVSSQREEEFTFSELSDLINKLAPSPVAVATEDEETVGAVSPTAQVTAGAVAASAKPKAVTEPADKKPATNPADKKNDEANAEFQAAIDKAQSLLQTPDEKLAAISQETGIDLIAAKKEAAGVIQKNNTDVVNDLKAASAKLAATPTTPIK